MKAVNWFLILVSSFMLISRPIQAENYSRATAICEKTSSFRITIEQEGNGKTNLASEEFNVYRRLVLYANEKH